MQRFRWIALQGSSRGLLPPLLLFAFLITTSGIPAHAADDPAACRVSFARIVSIQGTVELLRARQNDWSRVTRLDTPLCEGDRLRTGARSRAALFIQPETLVRVDQNSSISVSQTADETLVEFTQEGIVATSATAHTCGGGYFITRFPRKFRVNTPHLNAAVEGTEFLVAMRCESTELSVFEGKVLATSASMNVFPSQSVVSGQTLTVGGGEPPAIKLQLKPADAVQWTLYYPPITPAGTVPVEDCRVVAQDNRLSCLIARAEQFLRAGRVEDAQANIADALTVAPYSSDAKALSSIISLVRNDKAKALRLAKEAVDATPNSAPAWLALSYAQQADFKLEAALASAKHAAELTPSSALALARVAELQLSLGWTRDAEKTAKQAVAANPSESRAHMILGFVHLAQLNAKAAREDFEKAIELDSSDPLSRLGLGLAIIRKGKLIEGREQIEISVALDPTNSLIRSYVGKAYYEENSPERNELAATQFGLAKQLDSIDPTPWFYDAILKQTQNRPAEALASFEQSKQLNRNRAIYRSRLMLDQDLAARGTDMARTYTELGFSELALLEATKSVTSDPFNYSAHNLLANAYSNLPRHEIARQSELLQAKLREPSSIVAAQSLGEDQKAFSFLTATSFSSGLNEYSNLFDRDGIGIYVRGLNGTQDTEGDQIELYGAKGGAAGTLRQYRLRTEGFRENNDYLDQAYGAELHLQPSVGTKFNLEFLHRETETGDLPLRFDSTDWFDYRFSEDADQIRLGAWFSLYPQTELLINAAYQDRSALTSIPSSSFDLLEEDTTRSIELQLNHSIQLVSLIGGAGYYEIEGPVTVNGFQLDSTRSEHSNAYMYSIWHFLRKLDVTLGLSYDDSNNIDIKKTQTNPKIGAVWSPTEATTLRIASFRTYRRNFVSRATVEPTQIAGFNQFFDDPADTDSKFSGIGIDQRITARSWIGGSYGERELEFPRVNFPDLTISKFVWKEKIGRAYWYQSISNALVASVDYSHEEFARPEEEAGLDGIVHLRTNILSGAITTSQGPFSVRLRISAVTQDGDFLSTLFVPYSGSSEFNVVDLSAAYKLPRRLGIFAIDVRNLADRHFQFQDIDPTNPRVAPERLVQARVVLTF